MRSPPLPALLLLLLLCRCAAQPPCVPRPDDDSAPAKALLAPIVFQGRLAALAERGAAVLATFALQRPMKGSLAGEAVVVRFGGRRCGAAPLPRGLLLHGRYVVFAGRRGRRLVATAAPEPLSRRREIARVLCDGCARAPSVRGPAGAHPEPQSRLRLRCRTSGNPPPKVVWFKDGLRIESDGRLKVRSKRRQSQLAIARVSAADGGRYECRAANPLGSASSAATVVVAASSFHPRTTESPLWPFQVLPCPMAHYCLNGGLCSLYETVGEYVCECAEGFRGRRCESKAISTLSILFPVPRR